MCLVARKITTGLSFSISSLHDKGTFVLVSDHARQPSEFDPCQPGKKALPWRVKKIAKHVPRNAPTKFMGLSSIFCFFVCFCVCLFVAGKAGTC